MALSNEQKIFNLIRLKGSKQYQDYVPALTDKSPIGMVSTPILSRPEILKEFTVLLGDFIEKIVIKAVWENPLSGLIRKGGEPLGEFTAEIGNNPITPLPYDPTHPENLFKYNITDDKVVYYARNIKEVFKLSMPYEDIKGALNSYDEFNDYVAMKKASLESGFQLSQFNHLMEAIVVNYKAGLFPVSTQYIDSSDDTNFPIITAEILKAAKKFKFPSSDFNNYSKLDGANGEFKAFTKDSDIIVMATIDWLTDDRINYLANAFNLSQAEIPYRIIEVPEFAYTYQHNAGVDDFGNNIYVEMKEQSNIGAMVFDRRMLSARTDLEINADFFNPDTLVSTIYRHWWATFRCSPLANCLVFIDVNIATDSNANGFRVVDYGRPDGNNIVDIENVGGTQKVSIESTPSPDLSNAYLTKGSLIDVNKISGTVDVSKSTLSTYLTYAFDTKGVTFTAVKGKGDNYSVVELTFKMGTSDFTCTILAKVYQ